MITTNVADLRWKADHHSERVHQLLWGCPVSTGGKRRGFVRVTEPGGYSGWVDQGLMHYVSKSQYARWCRPSHIVISLRSPIRPAGAGQNQEPHVLYYGTSLRVESVLDGTRSLVTLPGLASMAIRTADLDRPILSSRSRLPREARRFLGIPYVWGGVTSTGMDCSGMIQSLYGRFGISLPRDTKDQIKCGESVALSQVRIGDLLFFDRHVAMALSRRQFIHSSRGGGGVRINSIDSTASDYRPDLADSFREARRIV